MYCSEHCRKQAHNSYHRVECEMLSIEYRIPSTVRSSIEFTELRMLLIGSKQGTQLRNLMEKLTLRDILTEDTDPTNKVFVNNYLSVLRICRTFNPLLADWSVSCAARALALLKRTSFFTNDSCHRIESSKVELEFRLRKLS